MTQIAFEFVYFRSFLNYYFSVDHLLQGDLKYFQSRDFWSCDSKTRLQLNLLLQKSDMMQGLSFSWVL